MEKAPIKSKTIFVSILVIIGGLVAKFNPDLGEFLKQNAAEVVTGLGMLFAGLRLITNGKVNIPFLGSDDEPKPDEPSK